MSPPSKRAISAWTCCCEGHSSGAVQAEPECGRRFGCHGSAPTEQGTGNDAGHPDFRVTPAKVFRGELDDQLADILGLGRATSPGRGAVVLPGGKLPEPSENGGWLHEVATLPTFVWREQLAGRGQLPTLVGGERQPLATRSGVELLSKDAPLFFDIVEFALQPIVDRRRDHHDDELQRHGQHSSPDCSRVAPFPSSISARIRGRISAMPFWTPRGL